LSVIHIIVFILVLTPEQAMQAAITKNVKLITTPNTSPGKQSLPMPPGIKPSVSNVPPKQPNAQKPFLPPPPTPPKLLLQQPPIKQPPPLPSTRPPLPTMPPPPPPPSLPPPPPTPNQMLMPQGVSQLPPPPMQPPPPIPPSGFPPMYPYPPLQNPAQSFANSMFSQPPNMISTVPGQYRPHEPMGSIQFIGESVPPRQPYGENYNQRENMTQQPPQPFSEFDMQDSYEENRQKYNDNRAFNRDGAFVGGTYGNGSQHFVDGGPHYSSESGQHYVDGGSQHYSDPAYLQYKRGFNTRTNRPPPPPPQYQNRQVRHHPYQRR